MSPDPSLVCLFTVQQAMTSTRSWGKEDGFIRKSSYWVDREQLFISVFPQRRFRNGLCRQRSSEYLLTVGKVCEQVVWLVGLITNPPRTSQLHSHRHGLRSSVPKNSSDCSGLLNCSCLPSAAGRVTLHEPAQGARREEKQGLGAHKCGVLNAGLQLDVDSEDISIYYSMLFSQNEQKWLLLWLCKEEFKNISNDDCSVGLAFSGL